MSALRGFFVTGTGTEVGKTVVACVIARTLLQAGHTVAVFKPAVSGLAEPQPRPDGGEPTPPDAERLPGARSVRPGAGGEPAPSADHILLRRAAGSDQTDDEIAPYRYPEPVSPHLAAEIAGAEIDPELIVAGAHKAAAGADRLVCEGVGGLMVPLTPDYLVRDFASALALPLVIVAPPGLGTINHTLLTIEAARAAGLAIASVILTPWPADPDRIHHSNRETITTLGKVPVHTLPHLDLTDPSKWPPIEAGHPPHILRTRPLIG